VVGRVVCSGGALGGVVVVGLLAGGRGGRDLGGVVVTVPEGLLGLPQEHVVELACRAHLGVWAERKRGLRNAALHWEWCELAMSRSRLAVVAPREHAKSETFTVNQVVWRSIYTPGMWSFVFGQTGDQSKELLARIKGAMWQVAPWMMQDAHEENSTKIIFANWARCDVAGAGKSVRGAHPDLIVGDDVLEEGNALTAFQRKRVERWWFGTVGGMSHPGTSRPLGREANAPHVWMPPTRVHLVGTPFHSQDLLMGMRDNPLYEFRRYAAEYEPGDLVDGLAVEVAA
jgi:hypothetical protein